MQVGKYFFKKEKLIHIIIVSLRVLIIVVASTKV